MHLVHLCNECNYQLCIFRWILDFVRSFHSLHRFLQGILLTSIKIIMLINLDIIVAKVVALSHFELV